MGEMKGVLILMLELLLPVLIVQGQPSLSIEPATWYTGTTLTIICDVTSITTVGVNIFKDTDQIYTCFFTNAPCSDKDGVSDYSDVDWSQTGKAVFNISKAKSTRDVGDWTCSGDDITQKSIKISLDIRDADCGTLEVDNGRVTSTKTTYGYTATYICDNDIEGNDTRICQANGSWSSESPLCSVSETESSQCWYYWLFLLMLILFVGLVGAIIFVSRYKTLVISTLYVHVTKNIVKLKLKPDFEPVPNTTYATCVQNGLTENAEFIDGLLVVEFRHLIPERQHDVIIYCQNPADMKLYKSETFAVFTLKESSNTTPKESSTVLALHSLDLTVYQTKLELSWISPIALDSTKVEYWVGSERHIMMSANNTSLETFNAELTTLLPERVITFTITGEKDGTTYPSGILHQKTLKGLTGCCP